MTARLTTIDKYDGQDYLVTTMSRTREGFWVADGTPARLAASASPGELGAAVRAALDASREGIDKPPRDSSPAQPLLNMLGLADYGTFMRRAQQVEVYAEDTTDGETIEITPQRNAGPREGFEPLDDLTLRITYDSPGTLGAEVADAFTRTK